MSQSIPVCRSRQITALQPMCVNLNKYGCYMQGSSVIVPPAQGTYGNMSRDMLYGPGETEIDGSITKDWIFKERYTMQFRIEGFNLINSTQYAVPPLTLGRPIRSAGPGDD